MKNFLGSIAGRVFLILFAGVILAVIGTQVIAHLERQRELEQIHHRHAVERITQFVAILEAVPAAARSEVMAASTGRGLRADLSAPQSDIGLGDADLTAALRQRLGGDRDVFARRVPNADCGGRHGGSSTRKQRQICVEVYLKLNDQTPLHLLLRGRHLRPPPPLTGQSPANPLFFVVCIGLLAYVVARMSTRPLSRLARAAVELGRDLDSPPLSVEGPTEVRRAATAFNLMQTRIRHDVQARTQMLAAITHDLQTPLTRLRLRLEKVSDQELRDKLVADLAAMQEMIREGLDLARSLDPEEVLQRVDLDSLLDSVCADAADVGLDVTLDGRAGASIAVRPNALRRCLTNVIDNAVKYGGYARVSVVRNPTSVAVRIRDGGPGIPEELLAHVCEPFYRIESSRSRDTGGTGLGLTIARNIVQKHGGTLRLRNHPEGGLEVTLELPVTTGGV